MKSLSSSLCCLFLGMTIGAITTRADLRWYVEAGAAYTVFTQATFDNETYRAIQGSPTRALLLARSATTASFAPSQLVVVDQRRKQIAPFITVGARFTDWLALELSYHFLDRFKATAYYAQGEDIYGDPFVPGMDPTVARLSDEVQFLSLAPELKWSVSSRFALTLSPAFNWVSSDETVLGRRTSEVLMERHHHQITVGASAGILWSLAKHSALALSYGYADLKPSRGRKARLLSGALRWRF